MLFAPKSGVVDGRQVGKTHYKNRLWAYTKLAMQERNFFDQGRFERLGRQCDQLFKDFNVGLHDRLSREVIEKRMSDLGDWVIEVVELNPAKTRKPYLAYHDELLKFLREVTQTADEDDGSGDS
jgi:hypothetical protein